MNHITHSNVSTKRNLLIVVVLIFLALGVWMLLRNTQTSIMAPHGEVLNYNLPSNNITVLLNDGSGIAFDESKWNVERTVSLKGEALFQVQKGSAFTVQTDWGRVEALGTTFNVKSWDNILRVECFEGRVKVRTASREKDIKGGQALVINSNGVSDLETINHQKPLWTTGTSKFVSEPLDSVYEELERQFNIKILSESDERTFTGVFQHSELKQALDQVCNPMRLKYVVDEVASTVSIGK